MPQRLPRKPWYERLGPTVEQKALQAQTLNGVWRGAGFKAARKVIRIFAGGHYCHLFFDNPSAKTFRGKKPSLNISDKENRVTIKVYADEKAKEIICASPKRKLGPGWAGTFEVADIRTPEIAILGRKKYDPASEKSFGNAFSEMVDKAFRSLKSFQKESKPK